MLKPAFIDLSHHNVIPQSLLPAKASGIAAVVHKATEGTGYTDGKVAARYALAQKAGMLWGLYHFVRAGNMDAQVDYFLGRARELEVLDDDTLLCLDWEVDDVSLDDAIRFLEQLEARSNRSPVLYSGHILKEALNGRPATPRLTRYRLWLAQYSNAPVLPPGYDEWWGWQYSESGNVAGINPPVDLNAYDGTAAMLAGDWSGRVSPAPPPSELVVTVTVPPGVRVQVV